VGNLEDGAPRGHVQLPMWLAGHEDLFPSCYGCADATTILLLDGISHLVQAISGSRGCVNL
jgi:hypothetical protein